MSQPYSNVASALQTLVTTGARRATKFVSPTQTVKVTRQRRPHRGERQNVFLVTIGRPNFIERRFIAACKRAGEPFPVKKVLLQHFTPK